jgi:hypothetical protein
MTAFFSLAKRAGAPRGIAFGNLIDLARLQVGTPTVEICNACNTINMGSARHCKCCSHKLPAFYANTKANANGVPDTLLSGHVPGMANRASAMDFAAFAVVINLLVLITASIPIA